MAPNSLRKLTLTMQMSILDSHQPSFYKSCNELSRTICTIYNEDTASTTSTTTTTTTLSTTVSTAVLANVSARKRTPDQTTKYIFWTTPSLEDVYSDLGINVTANVSILWFLNYAIIENIYFQHIIV